MLPGNYFTILPPAVLHASIEAALTQPWPLQLLSPLHELLAVLHSEVPLQLFAAAHLTSALSIMSAEIAGALTANKPAAATATATPVLMFIMFNLQIGYKKSVSKPAIGSFPITCPHKTRLSRQTLPK
jgi:hypothetical protein